MVRSLTLFALFALVSSQASARVFNLKDRSIATYFGGEFGLSQLSRQAYGDSCSNGSNICATDKSEKFNYSGEVGVLFASQAANFRLGVEFLEPQHLSGIKGTNASTSASLFTLNSTTRAIIPKGSLEFVIWKTDETSLIFGGSVGYAMVSMENEYTMTATGNAQLGTTGDFVEKGAGNAIDGEGFVGFEFVFSDNVTMLSSLSYRYLQVAKLTHQNAATVIGGTTVAKGDPVDNSDGTARTLNLSSINLGLNFRFYF